MSILQTSPLWATRDIAAFLQVYRMSHLLYQIYYIQTHLSWEALANKLSSFLNHFTSSIAEVYSITLIGFTWQDDLPAISHRQIFLSKAPLVSKFYFSGCQSSPNPSLSCQFKLILFFSTSSGLKVASYTKYQKLSPPTHAANIAPPAVALETRIFIIYPF